MMILLLSLSLFGDPQDGELEKILLLYQQKEEKAETKNQRMRAVEETLTAIEKYIANNPKASDMAKAHYVLADLHTRKEDFAGAVRKFDEFVSKFPEDRSVPQARFAAAELQLQLENDDDSARRFSEFVTLYPKDERCPYARLFQGMIQVYAKKFESAIATFTKIREEYAGQKVGWTALLQLASCCHLQEKRGEERAALEQIVKDCPESPLVATAKRYLTEYALLGRDAPEFRESDTAGGEFSVGRYKGSVVILYFFSARLPYVELEYTFLKLTYDRYKDRGLVIMGIGIDPDKKDFLQFTSEKKIPWPLYYDGKNLDGKIAKTCSVTGMPSLTVIDRKGKTRFFNLSGRDLRLAVEKLLDEK